MIRIDFGPISETVYIDILLKKYPYGHTMDMQYTYNCKLKKNPRNVIAPEAK